MKNEAAPQRRVLTYGTFDLLHYGHIRLLQRAAELGNTLFVGLSTDEFNKEKGKTTFYSYEVRLEMLKSIRYIDLVFPEQSWDQKRRDIAKHGIDVLVMGSDWQGDPRFEELRDVCEVVFFEYTPDISSSRVKQLFA
jgi:glycerol-3-phosphate cytidylyltransferase